MTKTAYQKRRERFMPNGIPRWVRVYDNGGVDVEGGSIDRYTVVFTGRYTHLTGGEHSYLAMNGCPFYPQGFGQHGSADFQIDAYDHQTHRSIWPPAIGRKNHLGTRIHFTDLPRDCQICTLMDYLSIWDLVPLQHPQEPASYTLASRFLPKASSRSRTIAPSLPTRKE